MKSLSDLLARIESLDKAATKGPMIIVRHGKAKAEREGACKPKES